ncbi:MAG: hypothetical protein EOP11_18820 [Proteobacteria bacterium]|nr:MAG: hypothetical protein EOP11_18820 [Pseudomonadota bacterium]
MKILFATFALLISANALGATELTCEIKDRSMRFREDYYLQPDGSAWVVLSTQALISRASIPRYAPPKP